jgi:hypothetical protein
VAGRKRRRKKRRWLPTVLLFLITPIVVWSIAFLLWLFWYDITGRPVPAKTSRPPGAGAPRDWEPPKPPVTKPAEGARESIPNEDRNKLDDILKQQ